tara:strand:- start:2735 stop:4657 length:1923 start_codon:yes stop_codon:yes gene_type:complete
MASLVKTYKGDLTTFIASKIWDFVKERAKRTGEPPEDVEDDQLRGQSSPVNPVTSIVPVPVDLIKKSQSFDKGELGSLARKDPLLKKRMIQERMRPMGGKPIISAERGFFPKNFNSGIKVRDEKLGVFLGKLALSLSSSFRSINQKLDETSEGITATKDGIDKTYKKLEQNSDSLESKLDGIIEALRYSGDVEKQKRDQREAAAKIAEQRQDVDLSNTNRILMQDMDRQEVRDLQRENIADDIADDATNNYQGQTADPMDDLPQLAEGGIVSGPDSGYLAVLHGDEAVVPLDNNYTQGEPSAVGEKPISQMPMMAERGITPGDNPSSMKPKFTINKPSSSPTLNFGGNMGGGDLAKAIQLPAKAAGLVTMGIMGNVMKQALLPPGIIGHLQTLTSPIAKAFGIPDVMAANQKEKSEQEFAQSQGKQEVLDANMGKKGRESGVLGKIKEFLFGSGGGSMTYRGTGGNTYVNNRTSGTGGYGTGGLFGGKKKEKVYKSKQDFGAILRATASKDAYMVINGFGDPERFKKKYGLTAEQFLALPEYPTDQSSLNSNVFAKNVTYDNAFDYYNSPEYGLKTSEIAYNMSMADEVNNMIDGLTDPQNQVVMNNTNNSSAGKQISYSAIAVRGNPLKEGTYVSPYSV